MIWALSILYLRQIKYYIVLLLIIASTSSRIFLHYFILNRQGKVITQSSRNQKVGDFITYCVVSGIQMRKVLKVKGPHRIHMVLDNGDSMLIVPGGGMIIGLLLDENGSPAAVTSGLRQAISRMGDS